MAELSLKLNWLWWALFNLTKTFRLFSQKLIWPGMVSRMPRHPAKEIKTGTLQSILKDLDLKM